MLNVIVAKLEERLKDMDAEIITYSKTGSPQWYYMQGRKKELETIINIINTQGGKWYDEYIDSCMIQLH